MELRDYSTSTCSQPVKSKRLQAVFQAQRTRRPVPPSLHNANAVAEVAHSHTEEQRLIQLCQKPSEQRTQQDVECVLPNDMMGLGQGTTKNMDDQIA
jgi:hypothetical protein